jgi:hypothetical protein
LTKKHYLLYIGAWPGTLEILILTKPTVMIVLEILHYLLLIYLDIRFLITYAILGSLPLENKKSTKINSINL